MVECVDVKELEIYLLYPYFSVTSFSDCGLDDMSDIASLLNNIPPVTRFILVATGLITGCVLEGTD